jgi:hypothetical protein
MKLIDIFLVFKREKNFNFFFCVAYNDTQHIQKLKSIVYKKNTKNKHNYLFFYLIKISNICAFSFI